MTITWTTETRKLSQLTAWTRNPRQIKGEQVKRLQESVEEFGQFETIAIGPGDEVYNGHQRLKSWGAKFGPDYDVEVRVSSRPLTEKEREKLTILAHKGAAGEWDFDTLANEFEVGELLEWGFSEKELQLGGFDLNEPQGEDAGAQVDKAEELRVKWGVESGQLWKLGEHRLICGDCTKAEDVDRLMQGERADMGFFDPPYGISFQSNGRTASKQFDVLEGDDKINGDWIPAAVDCLNEGGALYICTRWDVYPEWKNLVTPYIKLKNLIVWDKVDWSSGDLDGDYSPRHEFILFCTKGRHILRGHRDSNIWAFGAMNKQDYLHPTPKKIDLPEYAIQKSSDIGAIVSDWFSGSGTVLCACERLSRKCRAVEISAPYVAVTLQRFFDMTGVMPELLERV